MKNLVLIGMPGAGKSTVGVLLAKTLLMDFADTDLYIQNKFGMALCDIIDAHGTPFFLKAENDVICETDFTATVIATGGSAVYGETAMKQLGENGTVIYLYLSPETIKKRISDIKARGVALTSGTTIDDIFSDRAPLYEKYADITVNCEKIGRASCRERV